MIATVGELREALAPFHDLDRFMFENRDSGKSFRAVEVDGPKGVNERCRIVIRNDDHADPVPAWQRKAYDSNIEAAQERRWLEAGNDPDRSPARLAELARIAAARKKKADALVKVLAEHGIGPADARIMNDGHWKMAAKAAGVNLPSNATRLMVIGMLVKPEPANAA